MDRSFQAYGEPLETVTLFKYLVRVMTAADDNWPVLVVKIRKYWKSWTRMTKILGWGRGDLRISGLFLKAVVQAVLLFRVGDVGTDPPYGAGVLSLTKIGDNTELYCL